MVDRHTGLAIGGIDPVAYFTDGKPVPGGRISSTATPARSGASTTGQPRGLRGRPRGLHAAIRRLRSGRRRPRRRAPGDPALWVVHGERLYLFYTAEARAAFLADPAAVIAAAAARWTAVKSELAE